MYSQQLHRLSQCLRQSPCRIAVLLARLLSSRPALITPPPPLAATSPSHFRLLLTGTCHVHQKNTNKLTVTREGQTSSHARLLEILFLNCWSHSFDCFPYQPYVSGVLNSDLTGWEQAVCCSCRDSRTHILRPHQHRHVKGARTTSAQVTARLFLPTSIKHPDIIYHG